MGPDMTPVRTYRNGRWEVYLPGSSLKGVFRSHLEKVARTLCASQSASCNPFVRAVDRAVAQDGQLRCDGYAEVFCGDKFETRELPEAREFETHWESGPGGTRRDKKRRWKHQNPEGDTLDNAAVYTDSCPMCRLFGSTSFVGRVAISDAYLPALYDLWGKRVENPSVGGAPAGARVFVELRIPRLLHYPVSAGARLVRLAVREYYDEAIG